MLRPPHKAALHSFTKKLSKMQKIITFLTFNHQAEEAVQFYTTVFKNAKTGKVTRLPDGTFLTADFQIEGQTFYALNGGPHFTFSQGFSLFVKCDSQQEVDELWDRLSEGGEQLSCGWLRDKFGVSWQIIPTALGEMLSDPDPQKSGRAMQAMLQMSKLDIAALQKAYNGD